MLSWIREKFGKAVIGGLISFIAFVFIFSGVFSPKATRGLHEGAVAGTVNGQAISIAEFNRELNRRMEFFRNLGGGKISEEQLKAFKIREGVFQSLVNYKLMVQEAERQKIQASDAEVLERIREIPVFQKEGRFDLLTYKQVLQANRYTSSAFEESVRTDLTAQQWEKYFKNRIRFSEEELRKSFVLIHEKRELKYVQIPVEALKQDLKLAPKAQVTNEQMLELQKRAGQLAEQVRGILTAEASSDAKVKVLLKNYGAQVQTSGKISQQNTYLPSLGEAQEIVRDAFSRPSSIDPRQGGRAKVYPMAGRFVVALVSGSNPANLSLFEAEKLQLAETLSLQKIQAFQQEWMKNISEQAKIEMNLAVVSEKDSE